MTEGVKRDALLALEKRVAEAKGRDIHLDAAFHALRHGHPFKFENGKCFMWFRVANDKEAKWHDAHREPGTCYSSPTSRIDDALALVFHTLTPLGFLSWGIDGTQKDYNVGWVAVEGADSKLIEGRGEHKTPALAILLALLRSLTKGDAR